MQDWKMTDENAGLENARLENGGRKARLSKICQKYVSL